MLEKDGWRIDRRQVLYMVCIIFSRSYCSCVVVWSLMIHTHARLQTLGMSLYLGLHHECATNEGEGVMSYP